LIGSPGACVVPELFASLLQWESDFAMVDYVTKGSNFWTEHYSAVQADVPDDEDPTTQLNEPFMETLKQADIIIVAGQARSHCLANTVTDTADWFGEEHIKKFVLLTDATSDVGGCEALGETFVKDMVARGMQLSTTVDFLR
jgi:nicotinamidase-related amidase